jgi:hypothetical protein
VRQPELTASRQARCRDNLEGERTTHGA